MIPIFPEATSRRLVSTAVLALALLYVVGGGTLLKHAVDVHLASVAAVDDPNPGPTGVAALVNNEVLSQADATWVADADAVCKQGDPATLGTQEFCEHLSEFRARYQTAVQQQ
jgi:hypothetical protein